MKNINIKYFGMISSNINKDEEIFEIADTISLLEFKNILLEKYPLIADLKFKIAVNQEIVTDDQTLNDSDEIALLPPYAGG